MLNQIICFSHRKWSGDPGRTQHLMRFFEDVEIYYFELTVTGAFSKALRRRPVCPVREPKHGVHVFSVPPILHLERGMSIPEKWSQNRALRFVHQQLRHLSLRDPVIWATTPMAVLFLDEIPHRSLVYDCCQSWDQFPEEMESQLARDADLVFAASRNLWEHVAPCNRNLFLLPNGVNYELDAQAAREDTPLDPAVTGLRRPVFGYYGDIRRSLRLEPLIYTARNNPEWSFVVVGKVKYNPMLPELKRCRNIKLIGYRAPADVPACLAGCDACIELLHNDIADEDLVDERLYTYFAAEKPVASVYPIRYIPEFPDVVYGGQNEEEFEQACLRAGNELGTRKRLARREYAQKADWMLRAQTAQAILRENGIL